jgi:hypothetical protein
LLLILLTVEFTGKTNRLSNFTDIPYFNKWVLNDKRVIVNDTQYKEISEYLERNLTGKETFYDATSIPLLYVTSGKEFIPYFIPNVYLTSDVIQHDTVDRMDKYRSQEKLKLILAGNPNSESRFLDGVPNSVRSFLVYEYLNNKYVSAKHWGNYIFWFADDNSTTKDNQPINLMKLPYLWGSTIRSFRTDTENLLITQNIYFSESIKYRFNLPYNLNKENGNYLILQIRSLTDGDLNITFPDSKSTVKFDVFSGNHQYIVRISTIRDWYMDNLKYFYVSSSKPLEIINMSVKIGD